MIQGRSVGARGVERQAVQQTAWFRSWALPLLGGLYLLAFWLFFVMMHFKSQSWAVGQVLTPLDGYWEWFYGIVPREQVLAVRRSSEAAWHPFAMLAPLALMNGLYVGLIVCLRRRVLSLPLQGSIGLALLASVPLMILPNLLSSDIYSYIAFGRIATLWGGNPFIDPPSAFRGVDPFYQWVNWKQVPSVYGPTWIYMSMVLTAIVESINSDIIAYVLGYKFLALALHLANGWLIWSILRRWQPRQQQWGTAFYLLNPLVLIEFVGNAHNDVLMITCILLAILLHLHGRWPWAIVAFTLAVLAKWIAILILPLYGLALLWEARTWRQRAWRTGVSLALFFGLCVALYQPYWEGTRTLEILFDAPPQQRLINSLGDVVSNDIQRGMAHIGEWPDPAILDSISIFSSQNARLMMNREREANGEDDTVWREQASQFVQERTFFRRQQAQALENREWLNGIIRWSALGMLAIACLVAAALTRSFRHAVLGGTWIFFIYCSISAVWFWPWYLTWLVALAALLDWRVTGRTMLIFSILAPLVYVFFPPTVDPEWWQRYRALMVFLPPLIFAGWHGWQIARSRWRAWRERRASRDDAPETAMA